MTRSAALRMAPAAGAVVAFLAAGIIQAAATRTLTPAATPVPTTTPTPAATPVLPTATPAPRPTPAGVAWITLGSNTAAPGALDVAIRGGGFAPGEAITLRLGATGAPLPATLQADHAGAVAGQARVRLAPNTATPVQLVATGGRSRRTATATIGVVPYTPVIALSPYAALPGQGVQVQGHGFAPSEIVRLAVGSAVAEQGQADAGGAVQLTYSIPYTARTGFLGLVARGAASGRPAAARLYVVPLRPWATASVYAVHVGQQVQLAVHGFAAHEMIVVREETAPGRLATAWTDDGGNAALGPLTVPPHEQRPTYDVAGARSGAHATVALTALP